LVVVSQTDTVTTKARFNVSVLWQMHRKNRLENSVANGSV
jgi:hypothetical protein